MAKYCQKCGFKYESLLWGPLVSPFAGAGGGYCSAACRASHADDRAQRRYNQQLNKEIEERAEKDRREMAAFEANQQHIIGMKRSWRADSANQPGFHPISAWKWGCLRCKRIIFDPLNPPLCGECEDQMICGYEPYYEEAWSEDCEEKIEYKGNDYGFECRRCQEFESVPSQWCNTCDRELSDKGFHVFSGIRSCAIWTEGWRIVELELRTTFLGTKRIPSVAEIKGKYGIPHDALILGAAKISNPVFVTQTSLHFKDRHGGLRSESVYAVEQLVANPPKPAWFNTTVILGSSELSMPNHELALFLEFATNLAAAIKSPFVTATSLTIPPPLPPLQNSLQIPAQLMALPCQKHDEVVPEEIPQIKIKEPRMPVPSPTETSTETESLPRPLSKTKEVVEYDPSFEKALKSLAIAHGVSRQATDRVVNKALADNCGDYCQVADQVRNQISSYERIQQMKANSPDNITKTQLLSALSAAQKAYPDDYTMQLCRTEEILQLGNE